MRITSIELWSVSNVETSHKHCTLGLSDVDSTQSYILKMASGLDPDEILNQFYGVAGNTSRSSPDQRYYNLKPAPRTVVFNIKLNPQYDASETPASLRDDLYRGIQWDRTADVEIRFMQDDVCVSILNGFVTRLEADMFTKEPSVTITIKCMYPFLRSPISVEISDVLTLGVISLTDPYSTAPHGFFMKLRFLDTFTGPFILQGQKGGTLVGGGVEPTYFKSPFIINSDFATNDYLILNSEPDNRELYKGTGLFGTTKVPLMDTVDPHSIWPMIYPGFNELSVPLTGGTGQIVDFNFRWTYWGI